MNIDKVLKKLRKVGYPTGKTADEIMKKAREIEGTTVVFGVCTEDDTASISLQGSNKGINQFIFSLINAYIDNTVEASTRDQELSEAEVRGVRFQAIDMVINTLTNALEAERDSLLQEDNNTKSDTAEDFEDNLNSEEGEDYRYVSDERLEEAIDQALENAKMFAAEATLLDLRLKMRKKIYTSADELKDSLFDSGDWVLDEIDTVLHPSNDKPISSDLN